MKTLNLSEIMQSDNLLNNLYMQYKINSGNYIDKKYLKLMIKDFSIIKNLPLTQPEIDDIMNKMDEFIPEKITYKIFIDLFTEDVPEHIASLKQGAQSLPSTVGGPCTS